MERQKVVVLVRAGSFGLMRPTDYEQQIQAAKRQLEDASPPAVVEVAGSIAGLHERLGRAGVDTVVFFSRGVLDDALAVKRRYGIKVVLLTGLSDDLDEFKSEITILDKFVWKPESFLNAVLS
ncbi:MAG: hypothetical protein Q8P82_01455 [bacterium]|nr:hypothetical protein [bacterium]